jgi:ribosomal protein S18 acetylase RimI-like enzyme
MRIPGKETFVASGFHLVTNRQHFLFGSIGIGDTLTSDWRASKMSAMQNNKICVRAATLDDVEALSGLLGILFAQEADFSPDTKRQARALRLIIEQPAIGQIVCATEAGQVVGIASILFTVSTAEGGRAAWLEDMVVHPDKRRRGIGDQLLNEAIRIAQIAGCSRITLLTDATNEAAIEFYERAGFSRSKMIPLRLHF